MIGRKFTMTATVTSPTGAVTTDAEGNAVPTVETFAVRCHVQPVGRRVEEPENIETATSTSLLWCGPDENIVHTSKVIVDDVVYEVIGHPRHWAVGSRNDHLEVVIRRVDR